MKTERPASKKQELFSSPPQGYLSVAQAAAAGNWTEDQLRSYIARGHLQVVIIRGRKTKVCISPDALAKLKIGSRWPSAPEETATATPSSPPQGYLSVVQAAAAGGLKERQLRRHIASGHLPVVIITPPSGPQRGRGRKTTQWISPYTLGIFLENVRVLNRRVADVAALRGQLAVKVVEHSAVAKKETITTQTTKKRQVSAVALKIRGGGDATRN